MERKKTNTFAVPALCPTTCKLNLPVIYASSAALWMLSKSAPWF